jgi:hypothetical protein
VAITAYLASILASDPTTIQLLPQIPERLLDISGISAVAYLAARSVSSAGPLLTSAVFNRGATPVPVPPPVPPPPGGKGTVGPAAPPPGGDGPKVLGELLLIGDSLSKNATLQAFEANPQTADSGHSQAPGTAAGAGTKDCVSGVDGVPIAGFKYGPPPFLVDEKDGVPGKPGMYTRMTVNILCDCFPAKWTVRVTNPDGKYAEAEVAMHQLPPESKDAQKADPVDVADGAKPDAPESKDAQPDAPVDVPDKEAPPTS